MESQPALCEEAWVALRGKGLDTHVAAAVLEHCLEHSLPDLWLDVRLGGLAAVPSGVRVWMCAPDRRWASWIRRPADDDMQYEVLAMASRRLSMDGFARVYAGMKRLLSGYPACMRA